MVDTASGISGATPSDICRDGDTEDAVSPKPTFHFLQLPRELRDQIYHHAFLTEDNRSDRALRIERRNLKYFQPSAAAILLVLHHEYFLLNRQIAREALEVLFKHHTVFLSCGPFVLKCLLEKIAEHNGPGRHWLKWLNSIELDWVTFPNLRMYPPDREDGRDEWYWEQQDNEEVDVDYIRGAQYNGHYDEHDHEGAAYDDNFYDPADTDLYPSFHPPPATQVSDPNDPFGFAHHYPFTDPSRPDHPNDEEGDTTPQEDTRLDLLVKMEVAPLFTYLASPVFALSSITLPLYFISKQALHYRSTTRPGYALPLKIRYWVQVVVHALLMLCPPPTSTSLSSSTPPSPPSSAAPIPTLNEVRIKYLPWDVWASMDPADDLRRIVRDSVWFDEDDEREREGEAFRAVWAAEGVQKSKLKVEMRFVEWDGNVDSWRVGDEVEVVFRRKDG